MHHPLTRFAAGIGTCLILASATPVASVGATLPLKNPPLRSTGTLPPGVPLSGAGFATTIREQPEPPPPGSEPSVSGPFPLPTVVSAGFVVLVESSALPPDVPSNWSDVLDFRTHQAARQAFLVSDPPLKPSRQADRCCCSRPRST